MPNDRDVTIWINEHRLKALYDNGVDVENDLAEFADTLYNDFVPEDERKNIESQIQVEQEEANRYHEQNRRFALLEIVENGVSCYCESEKCTTLFAAASRFVKALKTQKEQGKFIISL